MIWGRCAACKYLRQRCAADCVFSPHFPCNDPQRFKSVHEIYGASNVAKMLQNLTHQGVPEHLRGEAVDTLYWEAQCRIENPVHGCVGFITQLHQHIQSLQMELAKTQAQITLLSNYNHTLNVNTNHHHHHPTNDNAQQDHQQSQQIRGQSSSNNTLLFPGFSNYY